jgi:hypothetical protein
MKKYQDIVRHGKSSTHLTLEGNPHIVIQEKLDGANASFKREGDAILCFSRNTQLDEHNTLRGFYNWVQDNVKASDLVEGGTYFGEWLVKHKLSYGENENKFYLFDIYDEDTERYIGFNLVKHQAQKLNLNLVPVFYEGVFQSIEHEFVNSTVNKARVSKIIHKLVDEGTLNEDYAIEDMGIILKNTGSRVFEDVVKEELDELLKVVKSKIGRMLPTIVKEVLSEENRI